MRGGPFVCYAVPMIPTTATIQEVECPHCETIVAMTRDHKVATNRIEGDLYVAPCPNPDCLAEVEWRMLDD